MTDNYTEVLEVAQQRLTEGDYLKVANFLKELHKQAEQKKPVKIVVCNLDTCFEWTTMKRKKLKVMVYKRINSFIPGEPQSNEYVVEWSLNGGEIQIDEQSKYTNKIAKILHAFGVSNLHITVGGVTQKYKNLFDYKTNLRKNRDALFGDDEEERFYTFLYDDDALVVNLSNF